MSCSHINDQNVTFSLQGKLIYKDQCTKCFVEAVNKQLDHQKSENGIDVCLKCFNGGCVSSVQQHSRSHYQNTQHSLVLRVRVTVKEPEPQEASDVKNLSLGGEGGFRLDQPEYLTETQVFCYACNGYVQDERLSGLEKSIRQTDSAFKKNEVAAWECEINPCEHTLMIEQVPQYKVASENLAKCQGCDLSSNLWLCLTCGSLGCGRKNYDGSGGNNHGVEHFKQTNHPLVVKLGTITPDGNASVHCYQCGDEVIDNYLKDHLANFGINVEKLTKTEKTIAELTIDANMNLQLSKVLEEGKLLESVFGPGFTGIDNIGNSCYMNSAVQVLFNIPEVQQQYYNTPHHCKKHPIQCFTCQASKVAYGLHSGEFSVPKKEKQIVQTEQQEQLFYQEGIRLFDLKQLVAGNNKEFLSTRQQDALEYLDQLFKWLQKGEKQDNQNQTVNLFEYSQSDVLTCGQCGASKVNTYKSLMLRLPVEHPTPEQIATWEAQQQEIKAKYLSEGKEYRQEENIPEYPTTLKKSFEILSKGDLLDASCQRCQAKGLTQKQAFKTFPKYLILPVSRFVLENWVPKKLNAMIQVDEHLDLEQFREPKISAENLIQDQKPGDQFHYNQQSLNTLQDYGFSIHAAKKGLKATNGDLESAIFWISERLDDPTLNDAEVQQETSLKSAPQHLIDQLIDCGYTTEQAILALNKTDNNIERAFDYILSHDMEEEVQISKAQQQSEKPPSVEGQEEQSSQYELYGINNIYLQAAIIHLGRSTHSGHYVAYIKKNNEWVLFNDSKVAKTKDPVLGKGYIYVYRRK